MTPLTGGPKNLEFSKDILIQQESCESVPKQCLSGRDATGTRQGCGRDAENTGRYTVTQRH